MTVRFLSARRVLGMCALVAASGAGASAAAQDLLPSRAVVQPLPPAEAGQLSAALQRLAGNPRDLDALIAAGNASLKLDDIDAALGFFTRAEEIAPGDPRPKAGRAAAMVREENPFDALRLFDEAERAGAALTDLESERALAYDLVGDNARAQELYRGVLARGEDPETARRLAVSLAISGDQLGMERVLLPMLQHRDLAAYRARAFSLAILGKVEEATTISNAVMPKSMAARVEPYLRYMPRLTRSQQAAAANLGNFPRSAEIGRDDPRMAQFAGAEQPVAVAVRGADARLVPAGEPLGPGAGRPEPLKGEGPGNATVTYRPLEPPLQAPVSPEPEPIHAFEPPPSAVAEANPSSVEIAAIEPTPAEPTPAEATPAEPPVADAAPVEVALADVPGPGLSISSAAEPVAARSIDLARIAGSREAPVPAEAARPELVVAMASPEPEPVQAAPVATPQEIAVVPSQVAVARAEVADAHVAAASADVAAASPALNAPVEAGGAVQQANVADAFADFAFSLAPTAQAADAVDIARITPPRERVVKVEAKPAAPKVPRRFWVQLATGRDRARLATDFRRISSDSKGMLKDSKAFLAAWGETNRLLTGPFKTDSAAQAFVTKLNAAGLKSFTFTSAEGEEVSPVAAR
jgi:tetratricopeptide (TPR) repeat protein